MLAVGRGLARWHDARMTDSEPTARHTLPVQIVPPRIVILDHVGSGAPGLMQLKAIAAALHRQVNEHFDVFWNMRATVVADTVAGPSDWVIGLFKDADQPGALGYHDTTSNGTPLAKVFPLLDAQDGQNLSTTISRELLEMLADPYLSRATQSPDGRFYALEVGDAVENDEYVIDGVKVSNFVTPHYFEPSQDLTGIRLDYLGLVKTPYEVRPGGYMQWNDGSGWHQITHAQIKPRSYRQRSDRMAKRANRAAARIGSGD
jgi:hypothetical protein